MISTLPYSFARRDTLGPEAEDDAEGLVVCSRSGSPSLPWNDALSFSELCPPGACGPSSTPRVSLHQPWARPESALRAYQRSQILPPGPRTICCPPEPHTTEREARP